MVIDCRPTTGSTAVGVPEPADRAALALDAAVVSITGPRAENEDAGYAGPRLLAVADGVGGNVGGAVASSVVVEALAVAVRDAPVARLDAAVAAANASLGHVVSARPELAGMATTLTAVALTGGGVVVAHIGDSRAYLLRDGRLEQLTSDQTVVQSLLDAGLITADQARGHPLRSIVLGVLHGADDDLAHLVTTTRPVRAGDRLLVCSDGLSGVVGPEMMARLLAEDSRPTAAATRLVRAALAADTHDNVTAVVADVVPTGEVRGSPTYSGWFSAGPPTS
jgi:PPM family protein phosphatase